MSSLYTPIPASEVTHTPWGFAVESLEHAGPKKTGKYFFLPLGVDIRSYLADFVDEALREWKSGEAYPATQLVSGCIAQLCARIVGERFDLSLDPGRTYEILEPIWNDRIIHASKDDRPGVIAQKVRILTQVQSVIDGEVPTLLALPNFYGACSGLEK